MEFKKLNLGCGRNIKQGWVNLDCVDLPGVDVVHDIEKLPLPFDDDQFDEIRCDNILEHVEYIPVLKDLHRILKPAGRLRIRVPHFTSRNNYVDPTHKRYFSIDTFEFFIKNSEIRENWYFDFHFSRIGYRKIKFFKKGLFWCNRLIEPLINCSRKVQYLYESTFLCRMFPANDIVVELIK
jgi:SAM-dependent methyltransferase